MKSPLLLLAAALCIPLAQETRADAWHDPLLTLPASPENVAQGLEIDAYQLGISAYVWGYPLVRMERVMRDYTNVPDPKPATSYRAPLNQIGWARELATPDALDMPTANNDTTYMSAVVHLTEPYILSVPDTDDRYYVVNLFNMWQELEHYIGRRTTGTKAGRFALLPPDWEGNLPSDVKPLQVSTDKVWLWGRLRVSPGEDMEMIHTLQDAFDLRPLSAEGQANWDAPAAALPPLPEIGDDPFGFMTHLAAALEFNAPKPGDLALSEQLSRIGLSADGFDPEQLSEPQRSGLMRGLADAPLVAVSSFASSAENRNGWDFVRGLDDFGFNYALRAMIAGPYLGGQGEQEAMYPIRYTDADGQPLSGQNDYFINFASAPPADAFWSLTMYDADSKMLVANTIDRFKVGSDTEGLKIAADGSFSIPISAAKPEGAFAANWLPAPDGPFYVILRVYQPRESLMSGEWSLPQLERK